MAKLTRDAILHAQDIRTETVAVPEWGGEVEVRGLTGTERDALEASIVEQRGRKTSINLHNIRAKLVAQSVVDEDGARIFTDDDVAELGRKSGMALDRVYTVAQRLSGLTTADIEELTKN